MKAGSIVSLQEQIMEVNNNKELIPLEHYLEEYKKADPHMMAERTGSAWNEESSSFTLSFMGRSYRIAWPEASFEAADRNEAGSALLETNQAKILVLRFLLEGAALKSSGKYLTYREVPWGEVYIRQFTGRCISRLAFSYGNRIDDYRARMTRLGAVPIGDSDAGFSLEVFDGYEVRFLLWAGDDEFPPSAQILFSDNFAAGFHAEDLVVVAEVIIGSLKHMS